jgi:hypothetical protein
MVAAALADRVEFHVLTTAVDPGLPRRSVVDGVPVSRVAINADSLLSKVTAAAPMLIEVGSSCATPTSSMCMATRKKNLPVTHLPKCSASVVLSLAHRWFRRAGRDSTAGALARWALETVSLYVT